MPTSGDVLEGLTRICRDLGGLAAAWHGLAGAFLLAVATGWRPSRRAVGAALSAPLLSVSLVGWGYGNPFNGSVFLLAAIATLVLALRLGGDPVAVSSPARALPGAALIAFGWLYPHFLEEGAFFRYLWAAPLGLLPCPSVSLILGLSLLLDGATSEASGVLLGGIGIFYGILGWRWLGVTLDVGLLVGSMILLAATAMPPLEPHRPAPAR